MKLLRLMKIVAAAQNLGGKVRRQTYAEKLGGVVKSMRHTIYDRTKADVEISAPSENLCAYQKVRRIVRLPASLFYIEGGLYSRTEI
jgi:hypothetical protein